MSTSKIILRGYLIVNVPVILLILLTTFLLVSYTSINFSLCLIIAAAVGWIYWELSIEKWIYWAIKNGVEEKRLHRIGMYSLLLWPKDIHRIEKIKNKSL